MGKAQLVCYPDSLGGDLKTLNNLLQGALSGLFPGGVHILPPYPSSGDRGFAPISYSLIDPAFGSWSDIQAIGSSVGVVLDLMVNHISRRSEYFQDFLAKGESSPYADMFIQPEKLWPDGEPVQTELDQVFLRRRSPFSTYPIADGTNTVTVWTTFGQTEPSEQIDLDINSPVTREVLKGLLRNYQHNSVSSLRLDAVGYVVKKRGTSCFFVEPEIFEFMAWIRDVAAQSGMSILPEVHAPLEIQRKLAANGYWTYDFATPFLVLGALVNHEVSHLVDYLRIRPSNMVTMLDCHDGIPVYPDVFGLASEDHIQRTIDYSAAHGANFSRLLSSREPGSIIDVHQINCTYLSALGGNENAFLAARAIQLFLPGIPQIYYVGLLAGTNCYRSLQEQQDGRAVNRKNYSLPETAEALGSSLVLKQMELIRMRNGHPAFDGECRIEGTGAELKISWNNGFHRCALSVDTTSYMMHIDYTSQADGRMLNL
jgi:sucrose phosphorylase